MEDSTPQRQKLLSRLDYFFVLRPTLFFPVWTVALTGFWSHERTMAGLPWFYGFWPLRGITVMQGLALLLLTVLMGAAFLLNQLTDVESDRFNNKLYLVASGAVPERHARMESLLLLAVGLGGLTGLKPALALCALFIFAVTGWAYSCKPFLCKDRPWLGLWANLSGSVLIYLFGWSMAGPLSWSALRCGLPYVLGIGAVYLLTTIPDRPGDAAAHKITLAVRWGETRIYRAAVICSGLAVVAALLTKEGVALAATLTVWPFFIWAWHRETVESALQTNKMATLALSLLICWRIPVYLFLLAGLFFFSKWYYRHRFNVHYPSLLT
ncbi:MAG TPA: UbiA family prenyltransferase [bacterium]|nr:UbiA family prenyltransferase [bacterium]HQG44619.1 UbiA family prenyltransferase [bacterium]HQI48700.1 UbiA family prenyltransferase [bacterium]